MSATTGFRWAHTNYAFDDVYTSAISGTGASNIDNLLTPQLSDRGTVTGTGTVLIEYEADPAAFGLTDDNAPISVVGLLEVAASFAGGIPRTWRVDIEDNEASLVYSSGWMAMPTWYDYSKPDLWLHLPARVYGTKVTIRFNQANSGATTITSGACWVSDVWTTERGIEDSWSWQPLPRGLAPVTEGGQGVPARRTDLSALKFSMARMSLVEAYGNPADPSFMYLKRLVEQVSNTEFNVVWPRTRGVDGQISSHLVSELAMYGQFTELGEIRHDGGDNYKCEPLRIEARR